MSNNTNATIVAKIDGFVIPNASTLVGNYSVLKDSIHGYINKFCELNGIEFDPEKDRLVQIWFVGVEGIRSENIVDHGFTIRTETDRTSYRIPYGLLPKKVFADHQEGDTISLKIPADVIDYDLDEGFQYSEGPVIDAEFTLAQTKYRYRGHGSFESVLARV